jgi:hypothetical protein
VVAKGCFTFAFGSYPWAPDGRLRANIVNVAALDDAVAAFNPTERVKGKTTIRVGP